MSNRQSYVYASPEIAALFRPLRWGTTLGLRLFEASCDTPSVVLCSTISDYKLHREIHLPYYTSNQRIWFGIQCALAVYNKPVFVSWAENWINGADRSKETADAVYQNLRHIDVNAAYWITNAVSCGEVSWAATAAMYAAGRIYPGINFVDIALQALWFEREFQEIDF
jgi:hypothetical protein